MSEKIYKGDCLDILEKLPKSSVDLIYLDPPFFTQKVHKSTTRDGDRKFSFRDIWDSDNSYADFLYQRVLAMKVVLKDNGSLFFHCDKSASHIVRLLLDSVFGTENFQSEIIWSFRRWSNSKKGLLPNHQTIFFYSKTKNFKFNPIFQEYSPTTNIDQIMQKRVRDNRNKTVYARDANGEIESNGAKNGVPLSDVWEIPFLNPKAKERVGYPTQKPIILLKRIIELVTNEGDIVLDPFCGSGSTLVASKLLKRDSIGIDIETEAIKLTKERLSNPISTDSKMLKKGRGSYREHNDEIAGILSGINYIPVQRNKGIDGLINNGINKLPTFFRIQRQQETIRDSVSLLKKASKNKESCSLLLIATDLRPLN